MGDYNKYVFSWKETGICVLAAAGVSGLVSWLFYRNIYAMILFFPSAVLVKREMERQLLEKRKNCILFQFKDMLQITAAALKTGYALENAFREAEKEFVSLYGEQTILAKELAGMNRKIQMNVPVELLLEDLAGRTGIDEINSFSQVFNFAKRSGGDIIKIFQDSGERIKEKAEVIREIETVTAAKKMEQKIMALVPFGILLYLGIGMPEYMKPLYGNIFGILFMSICLGAYLTACHIARKIVNICV